MGIGKDVTELHANYKREPGESQGVLATFSRNRGNFNIVMNTLSEYVRSMMQRHPRLNPRQMAQEAGVGESTVYGILNKGHGAKPRTLRKLADAWGTDEDYHEMMRLAGHPMLEPDLGLNLDEGARLILQCYNELSNADRQRVVAIMSRADVTPPTVVRAFEMMVQKPRAELDDVSATAEGIRLVTVIFGRILDRYTGLSEEQKRQTLERAVQSLLLDSDTESGMGHNDAEGY